MGVSVNINLTLYCYAILTEHCFKTNIKFSVSSKYDEMFRRLTLSVRSGVAYSSSYIFSGLQDIHFQNDYHPSVVRNHRKQQKEALYVSSLGKQLHDMLTVV